MTAAAAAADKAGDNAADLEAGYGDTAEEVGRTVALAAPAGAVGANLEDISEGRLFGIDEAVERIEAARAAAPSAAVWPGRR